jgi:hypothetical protein
VKLSRKARAALPDKDFALPKLREYPIPDAGHAKAALRDMTHESKRNQAAIRAAVRKRFPGIK